MGCTIVKIFLTITLAFVSQPTPSLDLNLTNIGLEKRYTESHEWIDVSADGKTCK
jgi:hypothetical protein